MPEALTAVKACEQINASIYSEAKIAALTLAAGHKAPELGKLSITDPMPPEPAA